MLSTPIWTIIRYFNHQANISFIFLPNVLPPILWSSVVCNIIVTSSSPIGLDLISFHSILFAVSPARIMNGHFFSLIRFFFSLLLLALPPSLALVESLWLSVDFIVSSVHNDTNMRMAIVWLYRPTHSHTVIHHHHKL